MDRGRSWDLLPPLGSGWWDSFAFSPNFATDRTILGVNGMRDIKISSNAGQQWADVGQAVTNQTPLLLFLFLGAKIGMEMCFGAPSLRRFWVQIKHVSNQRIA